MKEKQEIKIKYRSGVAHKGVLGDGNEYKEYEYDYVSATLRPVKRYRGALMLLMGVSGCDLHLIEWLSDNMGETGLVNNNELTRKAFIAFHAKYKGKSNKTYGEESVKKAFSNLVAMELLVPVIRGAFTVNPLFFYTGEEGDRLKSIRLVMEFKAGVATSISVEGK